MKKTEHKNNKKALAIGGLSALCVAVLAGAYFLTREPEHEFIPASTEAANSADKWEENADVDVADPSTTEQNASQVTGSVSDEIQTIISEDETGTVTSLSDSTPKEDTKSDKPTEKPQTQDDITNPEKEPGYDNTVPQPANPEKPKDDTPSSEEHPGQVYDPVFGWIDTGNTSQDTVDSDGDINKQIGTMD